MMQQLSLAQKLYMKMNLRIIYFNIISPNCMWPMSHGLGSYVL